ncbi:MAG: ispE [Bacteriovoracaceae bacterium]|nr:ispE [Bacteriovoracaceae bacterium]
MPSYTSYPNILCPAKVNLILRVGPRRKDGFHEIETLMTLLHWGDVLSLSVRNAKVTSIDLKTPGLHLAQEKNLVYRAVQLFSETFRCPLDAKILLKKVVPTGAGLGGGSSDAAKVLELLFKWKFKDRKKNLQTWKEVKKIAAGLGADIPFFLEGGAAWCTGFGEKIQKVVHPKFWMVIVLPKVKVPTPWAYRELDRVRGSYQRKLEGRPSWLNSNSYSIPELENDFEFPVVSAKPALKQIKKLLAESGAAAALMSGSGSSFFGLYSSQASAIKASKYLRKRGLRAIPTAST